MSDHPAEYRPDELSTADLAGREMSDPEPRQTDRADTPPDLDREHVPITEDTGVPDRHTDPAEVGNGAPAATPAPAVAASPLLASGDAEGFRARWTDVQTTFVDSPRDSVQQADALVAELMQHLATTFADERSGLERQWDRGDDIATDDLRTAFQRYRSFFERLLAT